MSYDGGETYPPWDSSGYSYDRPPLNHKISSVSAVSSMSSDPHDRPALNHKFSSVSALSSSSSVRGDRDSIVSLPSSPIYSSPFPDEQADVSHVRLSSIEGSGVNPSFDGSGFRRESASLPDSLRISSPPGAAPSSSLPGVLRVASSTSSNSPRSPSTSYLPFSRSSSGSYEPVSAGEPQKRPSILGRKSSSKYSARRKSSLLSGRHASIPETEEMDMGLLQNAMPMSFMPHKTGYAAVPEEVSDDVGGPPIDLTSFTGPLSPRSDSEWREIHRQERDGFLTGGLGQGLQPHATLTSADLLANALPTPTTPTTPPISRSTTLSRSFTLSRSLSLRPSKNLSGPPNLRDLAQLEANKSGKIIEVIVEESKDEDEPIVDMDLSSVAGANSSNVSFDKKDKPKGTRRETLPIKPEVFYPQANWRPFSMRWPYLTALIVVSVGLAAAQEYVLRKSLTQPLYKFHAAADLKTWDYFCFKYLPTFIAVIYGILWQVTDFEVKRLEPYYQLSKEGGALAAESINVDYITFFSFLRPLRALQFKHYAVAISSLATLMAVSLVPTLVSASVKLKPERSVREKNPAGLKSIHIDPVWSRSLSSFLLFIAILGCALIWNLQKRRSGLVADVKGIAGIAAMANRSHILMDFKDMDTATPDEIHKRLKTHRYTLQNSSLAPDQNHLLTQEEKDRYDQQKRHVNPHPLMLRLIAGIPFVIGMTFFMFLIPLVLFQSKINVLTEKAPWFLTVVAVGIKLAWGTLETDVRMIEPFYILSNRHASPKVLTLDYTAMAFGWVPIRAFMNGHLLVAFVGLGSVLAEILTICASSFGNVSGIDFARMPPSDNTAGHRASINAGEETFLSFWISFALAMGILAFLSFVATFVYWRRRHAFLPRQPNTISSVLAFIHQSKMLYDFVGTEKMNNDDMVKRLVGIGKTYGLGWFTGRDGEMHCGVDQEELASNYKHGQDGKKTNQPWNSNWADF